MAWGACVVAGGMHDCRGSVHGCRGHAWLQGGMWLWGASVVVGVCMVAGGHAWLWEVCAVVGGMHGCRGHAWWWGAFVEAGGAIMGYDEMQSMSWRYASYWNAFLLMYIFTLDIKLKYAK